MNNAKFVIQVSKGLIRQQRARRLVMFYSILIALLMIFGDMVLWPFFGEHPLLFLAYWAICAWVTLLAVLLALYDVLKVRAAAQRSQRDLAEQQFGKKTDDENPR